MDGNTMLKDTEHSFEVEEDTRLRLDRWLSERLPELSRARLQELMRTGLVTVDDRPCKASRSPRMGAVIKVHIPAATPSELLPEAIALSVLYEDSHLLVIDKSAGLVVHPAPGHASGTLVNALLHHCDDLQGIGGEQRPGIVHRLDMDTSGAIVVAKTAQAHEHLVEQFASRVIEKSYRALVRGVPFPSTKRIETTIGRSHHDRKKMAADVKVGRIAISTYTVEEPFGDSALLSVAIETGRTHQIRVQLAHIGHAVLGDKLYAGRNNGLDLSVPIERQMLHAASIAFTHPHSGERLTFEAPLPPDMQAVLDALRAR
jgi:23S rRNA pseudouridine1911/1915/1917 synthase